jgi:hypothetical protein
MRLERIRSLPQGRIKLVHRAPPTPLRHSAAPVPPASDPARDPRRCRRARGASHPCRIAAIRKKQKATYTPKSAMSRRPVRSQYSSTNSPSVTRPSAARSTPARPRPSGPGGICHCMMTAARSAKGWPSVDSSQSSTATQPRRVGREQQVVEPEIAMHQRHLPVILGQCRSRATRSARSIAGIVPVSLARYWPDQRSICGRSSCLRGPKSDRPTASRSILWIAARHAGHLVEIVSPFGSRHIGKTRVVEFRPSTCSIT